MAMRIPEDDASMYEEMRCRCGHTCYDHWWDEERDASNNIFFVVGKCEAWPDEGQDEPRCKCKLFTQRELPVRRLSFRKSS
jgi:hypothetical protein